MRSLIGERLAVAIPCVIPLTLVLAAVVAAQQPSSTNQASGEVEKKPQSTPVASKQPFTLTVNRRPILNISLKADKAKLTDVADVLSKELKTKVLVSPAMTNYRITIEFSELTLEQAMQLMAPEVYIDYQVKTSSLGPGKPLGIFFYPAGSEPPTTAVIGGSSQSLLIEGDTEEGVEPTTEADKKKAEEQPLRVEFKDNSLTIKARKQPLPLVLLKVGQELGIPVDIQYDSTDVIDTEINKLPVEDAMRHLSPNITVFLRADLAHAERRALRLVLAEPAKEKPQGF